MLQILTIVAIIYTFSSYINFSPLWRNSPWFYQLNILIAISTACLWAYLARSLDNKEKIFIATIFWDIVVHGIFLIIPILFFDIKIAWQAWIGIALIIAGFIIIKVYEF